MSDKKALVPQGAQVPSDLAVEITGEAGREAESVRDRDVARELYEIHQSLSRIEEMLREFFSS